jgi:AraC family transcriptional regulator
MDEFAPLAIQSLALELLTEASRRRARPSIKSRRAPRWLEQARELLHERFAETPSLAAVAATVAVHPVHLAREFRRWYGSTPGDYVRRLRIESACREIPRSDASLGEIAVAAGFYDQSHFCKTFKRFTGLTPAQFRAGFRRR